MASLKPFINVSILLMASTSCAGSAPETPPRPTPADQAPSVRALPPHDATDPHLWLEEVEGEAALAWVAERNAGTTAELEASRHYLPIFERTREILDSSDRIAQPSILGGRIYNFWQDAEHPRGIWRRTSRESYLSGEPAWETVIDVDLLAREEGVPWSFGGASCLAPDYRLCLVRLSRGGSDAVEVREFDTEALAFVEGGFRLPEAKQSATWVDGNSVLVSTDFGSESMTASGYPRIARLWRRGTPLEAAGTLFTAPRSDVGVWVGAWVVGDERISVVIHRPSFFETAVHVVRGDSLTRLDLPLDADPEIVGDRLVVYLRSPWIVGGKEFPAGSLVHASYEGFLGGDREFALLLETGERQTVTGVSTTRNLLLVNLLDEVSGELRRYRYDDAADGWRHEVVPAPEMGSIAVTATSPLDDRYFFTYSGFTQPPTLYLDAGAGEVREVRRMPAMFDSNGLVVEQHHATSADGTRVPYFVVRPADVAAAADAPTLLYAYGGFEVSMTPSYSPVTGAAWLERGGIYVLANLRGGGEFGPRSAVDVFFGEVNLGELKRHVPAPAAGAGPARKRYVFAEISTPSKALHFDALVHEDVYTGSDPSLRIYDTAFEGVADVNDPAREIDRLDLLESIEPLGLGLSRRRAAGVPRYSELLLAVCARMSWDPSRFRGHRCRIDYPLYGSQVAMLFDAPVKG